ncbi:MAG: divalent-cation tolerance protein CutA [Candidatus Poseidoniaceae archaeon]|uniref:Divalent-cation tolerance protein CutA n=1 Tax=uncultured Poseidoniia archaeon TaxID=1697135 RepID=A0A1B1TFZ8_9ARCH|nr:Divalent-cation tolerance protein CutA [uncultured Candidatus Thalassoarchaea sp.]MAU75114.1 divalent-cation tolerance protein CutA [Euryarchaeota archaeon]MBL6891764.1 divalent-cation tolerance protein CutA [Candidatus Poseidoniaceae archaeon]RAH05895.1 MAG: divalent-cation tolerance protein CutA [Euryarchaeota archaeon TMED132]|tara:strand:- start:10692 stop:11000 length:309 start_codon:yes stop_codon:yes gene_type:complete
MALVLVMVTFPDDDSAKSMIEKVLEQRLAACILHMEVNSSYIWKNQNQQEQEVLALFKTNQTNFEQLEQYISTHHPYDVPAILKIDASANQDYQNWIDSIIS